MSGSTQAEHRCSLCQQCFSSRNKLFKHLDESGHRAQQSAVVSNGAEKTQAAPPGNPAYDQYYRRQAIAPPSEWEAAYDRFREPLPLVVRTSLSAPAGRFCAALLGRYVQLRPVQWCPGAFTVANLTRSGKQQQARGGEGEAGTARVISGAVLLAACQECGAVQRQELVSCLPPLLLELEPQHIVADLCAAPGSKALMVLDALHAGMDEPCAVPPGLLVANEAERNRLLTMCQRARRLPRGPFLALCSDARYFPGMRRRAGRHTVAPGWKQKYQRIVADVPCSGDGTLRKNRKLWRKWGTVDGLSLHYVQYRLLCRAVTLLGAGGRLVYSTCSLNPIENEAVVAAALQHFGLDFVRVVPLPLWMRTQLQPLPGLRTWSVPSPTFAQEVAAGAVGAVGTGINTGAGSGTGAEARGTLWTSWAQVPPEQRRGGGRRRRRSRDGGGAEPQERADCAQHVSAAAAAVTVSSGGGSSPHWRGRRRRP
eukprot:COSAG01_NODE_3686_length_5796_cov_13.667720_2_plen_482_part_00